MTTAKTRWLSYIPAVLILLLGAALILCIIALRNVRSDLRDAESNLLTSQDSLREYILRNDELLSARRIWLVNEKQLRDSLESLGLSLREIEKVLNDKIEMIADLQASLSVDTVITVRDSIIYLPDSTARSTFDIYTDWYSVSGYHQNGYTTLQSLDVPLRLQVGLTSGNQIWVHSENPYVRVTGLSGAQLSEDDIKRKKPWISHGLQLGLGVSYGMINGHVDVGPYLGYGVTINF